MPTFRRAILSALISLIAFVPAAWGQQEQHIRFRNNLLPGHLTQHRVKRVITRTGKRGNNTEILKYGQIATWLQCNIEETAPGKMMVYQMLLDRPAQVISVRRNDKRIKPTPDASEFSLSRGSTRLHSTTQTPSDAVAQVPLTDDIERVVLQALLDFAHWPTEQLNAGHRWERTFEIPGFKGTQTFEFIDLTRIDGDVTARLTMYMEGDFTGRLSETYTFKKGQAIIYWQRMDRSLARMDAQAYYQRKRPTEPDKYELKLNVELKRTRQLNDEECDLIKDQMTLFSQALLKMRQRFPKDARALCEEYLRRWPDSMWRPAVEELASRTSTRGESGKRLSSKAIDEVLVKAVIAHEAAVENAEYDLMEATQNALANLVREYRSKLKKFAKNKDAGIRSRAVFALAFGDEENDLSIVQDAVRDKAAQVRELALAGLAARGSAAINVEPLILSLDDKSKKVRRRACQAIAACIPPEHYAIVTIAERMNKLIVDDDSPEVRIAAIRTLASVGAPADIPILEKALSHELDFNVREEIHRAIDKLKSKDV